jgi:hypothetical protein
MEKCRLASRKGMSEMKRNKKNRQARALAARQKKAYWGISAGVALCLGFVALVIFVPRTFSVKELVMAQVVRGKSVAAPINLTAAPTSVVSRSNQVPADNLTMPGASPDPSIHATGQATNDGAPISISTGNGKAAYDDVGFDRLSAFNLEVTEEMANGTADPKATSLSISGQIPPTVKALNDKQVTVRGFILPLNVRHGLMTQFLILKSQALCCYGIAPKMNEWVTVKMTGKGVKAVMDRPVNVSGTLHVGEIREGGALVAIYRMEADKFDAP